MFKGSIPALITPFADGKVDEAALVALVEWHVAEGSHGLVPVGTTGESPTLSHDEHEHVIDVVVREATRVVLAPPYQARVWVPPRRRMRRWAARRTSAARIGDLSIPAS